MAKAVAVFFLVGGVEAAFCFCQPGIINIAVWHIEANFIALTFIPGIGETLQFTTTLFDLLGIQLAGGLSFQFLIGLLECGFIGSREWEANGTDELVTLVRS